MGFGNTNTKLAFFVFIIIITATSIFSAESAINLGSSLEARQNGSSWVSPSGEFAFGFQPIDNQGLYLLAIWYDHIPEKTIVWSKNEHPVPEGSRVNLTDQGQLILSDSRGTQLWRAPIQNGLSTGAAMLDSGNFVLQYVNDSIWESFSYPTDTLLPGQKLSMEGNLTARQSETNYTDGRFLLTMQGDGNLVLQTLSLPTKAKQNAYWASNISRNINATNPADSHLIFDKDGNYLYIQQGNGNERHNISKAELRGFYYMARLDFDGVLRVYGRPRNTTGAAPLWNVVQNIPEDICGAVVGDLGSGACGFNSYCVNMDGRSECFCPQGYSLLDKHDTRKGCHPDFPMPTCHQHDYSNIDFVELNNTNWPMADYDFQILANKDMCKQSCLTDCFCAVAIYNNANRGCWKKRLPLSNGRESNDLYATYALIKVVRVPQDNSTTGDSTKSSKVILLASFLGSSVFLNLSITMAFGVVLVCHRKKQSASSVHGVQVYSYKQLEEATGGFEEQLGRGSFGTVYKGVLRSIPRRAVAIKRLDKVEKEGEKEFMTEVSAIGRTHHKNLVTLLGYCDEGDHRLLVYEYMSNGSLAAHLFGSLRPHWNQRMQIAFGIARGLTYLHDECGTQIIHCDVKPQNILLDEFLAPKISDFGMAKLLLSEQSRAARSHIRGTIGYFAPEWFRKASITAKVDVYSFGAMLLEIVCCKSSVDFGLGDQEEALIDLVYDCYCKRKLNILVENDDEAMSDLNSVERVVMVGIWCVQEDASVRPSMKSVCQMLEGVLQVSVPPRPSGFSLS